jgi:hypothetical protein
LADDAAERLQIPEFGGFFDALGYDLHAQVLAEADDSFEERLALGPGVLT